MPVDHAKIAEFLDRNATILREVIVAAQAVRRAMPANRIEGVLSRDISFNMPHDLMTRLADAVDALDTLGLPLPNPTHR